MATNIPEYFSECNWQIQLSPSLSQFSHVLAPRPETVSLLQFLNSLAH